MNLRSTKPLRSSIMVTGLLAAAMSISACQQKAEPEPISDDRATSEESVPMSADPAEPNDIVVTADDADVEDVQEDTIASVNTGVTQLSYLCSPALKVEATYKDDADEVVIETDKATLTLNKTNEGSNPEVFKVATGLDGGEGFTEWRVAHTERATGVIRTAGADESIIDTYECNKI